MPKHGPEVARSHKKRIENGFYQKWMRGYGIDVGCGVGNDSVLPNAIAFDRDHSLFNKEEPWRLPFADDSFDWLFSSHCLEHIVNWSGAIKEWHRVVEPGAHIVIAVPHQYLYEKKCSLPSCWNGDHKRYYTASVLFHQLESSLEPNTWRLRECFDHDDGYTYDIGPEAHCGGACEIVTVIQKIEPPQWGLMP